MNVTLFGKGKGSFADVIKLMISRYIVGGGWGGGIISKVSVFIRENEKASEDKVWSYGATSHRMTGAMKGWKRQGRILPLDTLEGALTLASSLQNCARVLFSPEL